MVIGLSPVADRTSTATTAARKPAVKAKSKVAKSPKTLIPTSGTVGGSYKAPQAKTINYADNAIGDSQYLADAGALKRALSNYATDDATARERQKIDYGNSLRNLGWNADTQSWDVVDKGQGYGQTTNAARQNYAGRGMLQGSGYNDAMSTIGREFGQQKTNMGLANDQFLSDADTAMARYKVDNEEARLASLNAAIERLKAKATSGLF